MNFSENIKQGYGTFTLLNRISHLSCMEINVRDREINLDGGGLIFVGLTYSICLFILFK